MSLVAVYEDLQRRNAPSHLTHIAETLQLLHCGIFLDDHHALFDWRAVTDYGYLARLLVHPFYGGKNQMYKRRAATER